MAVSPALTVQPHCLYPMSRYEAELHWEFERQKLRTYIASLPSSSFEKTKFEEDEGFYATFPEARQAAINHWIAEHFPFAPWGQSQVAQYQDPINVTCGLSLAPCASTPVVVPTPTVTFTTYTLADALKAPPSPRKVPQVPAIPDAPAPPIPTVYYNYSDTATRHNVHNRPDSILTADRVLFNKDKHPHIDKEAFSSAKKSPVPSLSSPPPEDDVVLRTLQLLAPARRLSQHTKKLHAHSPLASRNRENPYPSISPTSSYSTLDTPPCSPISPRSLSKPIIVPSNAPLVEPQYTGDWEKDAIATAEYLYSAVNVGKKPSFSISVPALPLLAIEPHIDVDNIIPFRRHHHTHRYASRHRARPYSPPPRPASRTPSRERSQSTSPPKKGPKMLRDKNGKPIMACLFCRGRKIACGPPPKGSTDPTCNQCARRGLDCRYPTINRRGMRKKKPRNTVSEATSPLSNTTGTALELVKINEGISISDYSDGSPTDWDDED